MPGCDLCLAAKGVSEVRLFEDPHCVVIMHPRGAAPGHVLVVPRVHYPIMEQMPDEDIRQLFRVAQLMMLSMEKGIASTGVNFLIMNGTAAGQEFPHFCIHLIPRGKDDAVKIAWEAMAVAPGDMDNIEAKLKEMCGAFTPTKQKKEEEVSEEPVLVPKESYPVQHVRRIP